MALFVAVRAWRSSLYPCPGYLVLRVAPEVAGDPSLQSYWEGACALRSLQKRIVLLRVQDLYYPKRGFGSL